MKLLDKIISVDELTAVSESLVSDSWPLFENGCVQSLIIIELVAQTAGINIKWNDTKAPSAKDGGGGGVLAGIKKAVFHVDRIPVDATIQTCSKKEYSQMNYSEFLGRVTMGEKMLGEVVLQLFRTD